jgi:FkbM family methyltransferase
MSFIKNLINKYGKITKAVDYQSYSQCGEDRIINFLINFLNIGNIRYVDIGAYHPIKFSNTYFFYKNGFRGICIDPNPRFKPLYRKIRPHDIFLNVGISNGSSKVMKYYCFDADTLNTFSCLEADRIVKEERHQLIKISEVPTISIEGLISQYIDDSYNILSIDVEGIEIDIIKSLERSKFRPEIICIETLTYSREFGKGVKETDKILSNLSNMGYSLVADTYINSIFIKKHVIQNNC